MSRASRIAWSLHFAELESFRGDSRWCESCHIARSSLARGPRGWIEGEREQRVPSETPRLAIRAVLTNVRRSRCGAGSSNTISQREPRRPRNFGKVLITSRYLASSKWDLSNIRSFAGRSNSAAYAQHGLRADEPCGLARRWHLPRLRRCSHPSSARSKRIRPGRLWCSRVLRVRRRRGCRHPRERRCRRHRQPMWSSCRA